MIVTLSYMEDLSGTFLSGFGFDDFGVCVHCSICIVGVLEDYV